ncbi:MAG TPA: inositol monophosphatase family protein [Kofleriaceae bacterium]|jgi:histidinol-phosphatase|nr:inositol monophosphatase family protein [Kofleriaceae bacterium]
MIDLERAVGVARDAVAAAGAAALAHLRRGVVVETKPDLSPVTAADRAAEDEIVGVIRAAFPDHAILGEEGGARGSGAARWIVDPIDGTRGFARGGIMWGPMVALEVDGELVVGALALPALGQTYWAARGGGAWRDGARLAVSAIADLADATLSLGELRRLAPQRGIQAMIARVASSRCYGDLAGCALVLDGRAEAWIEGGVQPWDVAAPAILIREAGGRYTDWHGGPSFESGYAIASNGHVHDEILRAMA